MLKHTHHQHKINKINSPKIIQPRGAANLQPRGASMGSSISNDNTATFGDKGYEDVMIIIPKQHPNPKPKSGTNQTSG